MIESRSGLSFMEEAGFVLLIGREMVGQKLQGDCALEPGVLGFVDNPHPAFAKLLDDAIVRNCLTDHVQLCPYFYQLLKPWIITERIKNRIKS